MRPWCLGADRRAADWEGRPSESLRRKVERPEAEGSVWDQ